MTAGAPAFHPPPTANLAAADQEGRVAWVLTAASLAVGFLAMPWVYGLVAFHGAYGRMMKAPVLEHVAFNCIANVVVMLGAIGLTGRLDQKLTEVFRRTLIAHGAVAFLTLITRHYYSIPMLLTGVPCSALLGSAVVSIRQRTRRLRVGILGPDHPILTDRGLDCERIAAPAASIRRYDLLLITFDGELPPPWAPTLSRALLAGKRVRHVSEFIEEARGVVAVEQFELDHLPEAGFTTYRTRKRLLDLVCVAAAAPLAAPVLALACLGIALTMGRPILFIQPRVGLGGRTFAMVKLRTMRADGHDVDGVATARSDGRITPLGRLLRRFHIDELPQLWNVLVGDMSVVGPRPEQPGLARRYGLEVPAFAFRQLVRPGITGWAQVRAGYAADLAETRVKLGYDLFYLKNFSLGLDAQIFARTFWTLISGGGVR